MTDGAERPDPATDADDPPDRSLIWLLLDAFVQFVSLLILIVLGFYTLIVVLLVPSFIFKGLFLATYVIGLVVTFRTMVRKGWPAIFVAFAVVGVFALLVVAARDLSPVNIGY
ncbi:MAG TPA: hypothetical protein VID95_03315 [Candidatus Limnocylindrales bacterium]|jgi:hypothetical protein